MPKFYYFVEKGSTILTPDNISSNEKDKQNLINLKNEYKKAALAAKRANDSQAALSHL